jgi:hypothetical protein
MSLSTLAQIKKKVRRLTASPSTNQLSNADLEEYIDTFYEQDFPSALKIWNLHSNLEFFTIPNEDRYSFDTDKYQAVLPPVYIDGYQSFYSQSQDEFFKIYPRLSTEQNAGAGDGSAGPYTFTLTSVPVLKRQVTVSATASDGSTLSASDVPASPASNVGTWIDNVTGAALTGAINYVTGVCTITFTNTVDATENLNARFSAYQASRPGAMLFYQDYFILRPVPDKVYRVVIEVYETPSQLLSSDDHSSSNTTDVKQWWQYIAFGAAIKVLQDRQDMESIQNLIPFFKEQENLILYRTATQQAPERTATIFTDQAGFAQGGQGFGGR